MYYPFSPSAPSKYPSFWPTNPSPESVIPGCIWQYLEAFLVARGSGIQASSKYRPGMLLTILQCTKQTPHSPHHTSQNKGLSSSHMLVLRNPILATHNYWKVTNCTLHVQCCDLPNFFFANSFSCFWTPRAPCLFKKTLLTPIVSYGKACLPSLLPQT